MIRGRMYWKRRGRSRKVRTMPGMPELPVQATDGQVQKTGQTALEDDRGVYQTHRGPKPGQRRTRGTRPTIRTEDYPIRAAQDDQTTQD